MQQVCSVDYWPNHIMSCLFSFLFLSQNDIQVRLNLFQPSLILKWYILGPIIFYHEEKFFDFNFSRQNYFWISQSVVIINAA